MNYFKVGTNFDMKLIDEIAKANAKSKKGKVVELYGSTQADAEFAARPDFRLPNVGREYLIEYIKRAKDAGLNFNYTLNSINPCGSKREFIRAQERLESLLITLSECGCYRVTVANPMMLEFMKHINHKLKIELSTIAHIDTVTQIRYYFENYGVTKICANLNKNRNFDWLEHAARYCKTQCIELELMANEFCGVGGNGYATHCIYRDSCYICHSTNRTMEDDNLLDHYPMEMCTMSRNQDPSNWLKSRFIRPEDLSVYNNVGIYNFKLTGRTGSTEYLMKVVKAYLKGDYRGNLLGLWKPLESITARQDESFTAYNIPNKALNGFIDVFAAGRDCDREVCGITCRYCNNFYDSIKAGETK